MNGKDRHGVRAAQVVLSCADLSATLCFFTEDLGFRLDTIYPADNPAVAEISGHGLHLQLRRGADGAQSMLRLLCSDPAALAGGAAELTAPNGTRIEIAQADPPLVVPRMRPSLVVTEGGTDLSTGLTFQKGRAGMRYRDLIPDRQGGSIIASHIWIPEGGPVPDYVHFHKVRFQMIYCYRGWVRVVYEDQGPPFVLREGDCVLQPPQIRHRVLESSPGLEVIEVSCPADHETCVDHDLALPTPALRPERDFSGQHFVRHQAMLAPWQPYRLPGFTCRDTGIAAATAGLASVRVARLCDPSSPQTSHGHDAEFLFLFVLEGGLTLHCEGHAARRLSAGSAMVVPAGMRHAFAECTAELQLLEVALPAAFTTS